MSGGPSPEEVLESRRVLVCVGTGGVGKTTISAALALAAARRGRRVLVLTIDPARRLADALGVAIGNEPQALPPEALARLGVPPEGQLSAMMLDMKRTFDDLVQRFAESEEARERILGNPIYQHVSDALAGSAEYSAMEKVYELAEQKDVDLIVLDTPPSAHALDFLEAPERLLGFLDSRVVQLLLHPAFAAGRLGFRVFQRGAQRVLQTLERVSGVGFLEDISEFLLAFEGMSEGFRARARRVQGLLFGPDTAFLVAAGPARESVLHAAAFLDRLEATRAGVAGIVVNRIHLWPDGPPSNDDPDEAAVAGLAEALARSEGEGFDARGAAAVAIRALRSYSVLVARDAENVAPLRARARAKGYFWRRVPLLDRDVHDLDGLAQVATWVMGDEAPEAAAQAPSQPRGGRQ
jgi:anion-transporting  ArsA/GET3 family ATPase